MYGRIALYELDGDVCFSGKNYLDKAKADAVMDAMERRIARLTKCVEMWKNVNEDLQSKNTNLRNSIKKLESIPHTDNTAVIEALQRGKELEEDLVEERGVNAGLRLRIKELESIPHTDNTSVIDALQKQVKELEAENERLKGAIKVMHTECDTCWKIEELRKENAKLECLALHAMSEYCFAQGTIIQIQLELTEQPLKEDVKMIHKVNIRDRWGEFFCKYYEAYRKAKESLKEGK